jgi:hypothetical protein
MSRRYVALAGTFAAMVAIASLRPAPAAGQQPAGSSYSAPRTAWGHPDLQGVWTNKTITPFERPDEVGGREFFTDAEIAERESRAIEANTDEARFEDRSRDVGAAYNDFWWDRGTRVNYMKRTSQVIDPPDGKLPPLTPEAQQREAARTAARRERGPADSWLDRSLYDRCILRNNGLPGSMGPTAYNSNYQILQTPESVVILIEMVPHARIIPIDGRPHLRPTLRQWMGDSRGRWEGDTLVVETTNFNDRTPNRGGANVNMRMVERFRRVSPDTIDYQYTIEDPTTFTRPWTAAIPMTKETNRIYDYACHEGNYGLEGILRGARADDKAAAEAAPATSRSR